MEKWVGLITTQNLTYVKWGKTTKFSIDCLYACIMSCTRYRFLPKRMTLNDL